MFKSLLRGTEWKCLELPAGKQRSSCLLNPHLSLVQWPEIMHSAKGKLIFISEHINSSLVNVYLNMSISLQRFPINLTIQFSSVTQSCPTLWYPMNHSTQGFPVHHQLPEFTQTHVHRVSDAIQPSHPLSSPSPPAFHLSQHQDLFRWISSSHQVAKVLEFQLQHQSFQWVFRTDFL